MDHPARSQSLYRLSYPAHIAYLVPRLKKEESYTFTPSWVFISHSRVNCTFNDPEEGVSKNENQCFKL